jgi:hypothetical protein
MPSGTQKVNGIGRDGGVHEPQLRVLSIFGATQAGMMLKWGQNSAGENKNTSEKVKIYSPWRFHPTYARKIFYLIRREPLKKR